MKKASFGLLIILVGTIAFANGRTESFGRNTDPDYDYVKDNSVVPTGLWQNQFETIFDTVSQKFVPYISRRTCTGLVAYIDHMPIRSIEWGIAKNEPRKTFFEVYVISDPVGYRLAGVPPAPSAAESVVPAAGTAGTAPAAVAAPAAGSATAAPAANTDPAASTSPAADVVTLLGTADVKNIVSYKLTGRSVVFDFVNLPPTTKKITVKIQTDDVNRYVETSFRTQ